MTIWLLVMLASEQVLHKVRDEAVVTLADRDRADPAEFRWVLVNGRGEWSVLVDRERGRVLICTARHRHRIAYYDNRGEPRFRIGECAEVYEGPVVERKR